MKGNAKPPVKGRIPERIWVNFYDDGSHWAYFTRGEARRLSIGCGKTREYKLVKPAPRRRSGKKEMNERAR